MGAPKAYTINCRYAHNKRLAKAGRARTPLRAVGKVGRVRWQETAGNGLPALPTKRSGKCGRVAPPALP
jgi:hypothetical protein